MIPDLLARAVLLVPQVIPQLKAGYYKPFPQKGGAGSGNFGHAGRPGLVGGSSSNFGKITSNNVGSYSGQTNYVSKIYTKDGKLAGTLQYSVFKGKPQIDFVEANQTGIGAGAELIRNLANEYGYENIEWGMMTESGYHLQEKLDKEYGFERTTVSYDAQTINSDFNGVFLGNGGLDFYGQFGDNATDVVNYLENIGAQNIDVQLGGNNESFISATLPEPKEVLIKKSILFQSNVKTYSYMLATIERMVRNVYNGTGTGGDFVDILQSLITGQLTQAFRQAWEDDGNTDFNLPPYLQSALDQTIIEQADFDFIYGYYQDIINARVDGTPIDPLLARAALWANRYNEAYNDTVHLIEFENGGKEEWVLGDTEEHCWICRGLNGIVMYAREWEELGVEPQNAPNPILSLSNGDENGCGGWRCDCSRRPTDKRRSPKGFETVLNLIGG